jgi:hypothetical protein
VGDDPLFQFLFAKGISYREAHRGDQFTGVVSHYCRPDQPVFTEDGFHKSVPSDLRSGDDVGSVFPSPDFYGQALLRGFLFRETHLGDVRMGIDYADGIVSSLQAIEPSP